MRAYPRFILVSVFLVCLVAVASSSSAQPSPDEHLPSRGVPVELLELVPEPPVVVLSDLQLVELETWTHDFAEWQKWADRWLNRRQPGKWAYSVERSEKPDPPVWLDDLCALLGDEDQFVPACTLLASWRQDPIAARDRQTASATLVQLEAPTKTSWWQHVHLDALWSTTRSNMTAFGLFGAHLSIEVEGRLQVFIAPGIMLVSVPGLYGTRELWPATDWGVSYRLFNAGRSSVHFNLVHAWILAPGANLLNSNMTLAGFSFTFRPHPR